MASAPGPIRPRESARRERAGADGVVLPDAHLASRCTGMAGGETGVDDGIAERGLRRDSARGSSAATCSGPCADRGPMTSWKGWWGEEPPYHVPTFVLTHHARAPLAMEGGTSSASSPTASTRRSAGDARPRAGSDVRIGGGVSTIRQYLAGAADRRAASRLRPVLLGAGEHLSHGLDLRALGYE